jgi:hypothetical protein
MSRRPAVRLDGLEVMGEGEVAGNEWLVAGEDIAKKETKRQPSGANRNEVKMALRQTGRPGDQQTKRLRA